MSAGFLDNLVTSEQPFKMTPPSSYQIIIFI